MTTVAPPRKDSAKVSRFDRFVNKFKLDSHHEIERFRVMIAVITVLGVLVISAAGYVSYKAKQVDISGTAQYTNKFVTSYTQQEGTVDDIYTNSDRTRAVMLFSFDGTMSRNPNDYEIVITGVDKGKPKRVESAMTAKLVSFGDSGSMGLIMDAPEGFESQILNVTMSAKRNLSSPDPMNEEDMAAYGYAGETFTTRDSWRMMLNPAGTNAPVLAELDAHDFDPRAFLINSVFRDREVNLRRAADDTLVEMRTAQDRIGFYHETLADMEVNLPDAVGAKIVIPTPNDYIAGDEVQGLSREEVKDAINIGEPVEAIENKSEKARELDTYDDGTMPTTYELITQKAVPGGVQFDWHQSSIQDGYLQDLMPTGYNVEEYLNELRTRANEAEIPKMNTKFMLSNGKSIDSYDVLDNSVLNLQSNATNLVSSYRDFYKAKVTYQTKNLVDLLALEAELDETAAATTVGTNPDSITINRAN